jgi:Rrf2 family protein
MLELSSRYGSGEPVRIRKIAERHDVPPRFLVQILPQLKGAGLVASTRGAAGGYHLLRPPESISLTEVMEVIEGGTDGNGHPTSSASPDSPAVKVLMKAWQDVNHMEREMLKGITFADLLERVPAKNAGSGNFVIGTMKVRPRVDANGKPAGFKRNQHVNFWMQVYNLGVDKQTHKPSATIEYEVVNAATNKAVVHAVENSDTLGNVGEQITLQKTLPLASLEPGLYRVTIKVNDNISKQTISPTARFAVE